MRTGRLISAVTGVGRHAGVGLVRFYRLAISPLKPPCCRFQPSCSAYAEEAIRRFGLVRGLGLAVWRLLRCHPFYRGSLFDPVPVRFPPRLRGSL